MKGLVSVLLANTRGGGQAGGDLDAVVDQEHARADRAHHRATQPDA